MHFMRCAEGGLRHNRPFLCDFARPQTSPVTAILQYYSAMMKGGNMSRPCDFFGKAMGIATSSSGPRQMGMQRDAIAGYHYVPPTPTTTATHVRPSVMRLSLVAIVIVSL